MFTKEIENLLKEQPLYDGYKVDEVNYNLLESLFTKQTIVDMYCPDCKKESTFKNSYSVALATINDKEIYLFKKAFIHENTDITETEEGFMITNFWNNLRPTTLNFTCQRDREHKIHFVFIFRGSSLMKIGQYPSLATLDNADLQKYKKVLENERFKEFSKGIGLASHGVGIGSFVYLRRVFEFLIEESHLQAKKEKGNWNEDEYNRSKMNDKIKLLKDYLPLFLVKNREIYGILSKGIHELNEVKCLEMFPNVRVAIEIILDEKIAAKERESKINRVSKYLKDTHSKL